MRTYLLISITLIGGLIGGLMGRIALLQPEAVWKPYMTVPSARRLLAQTGHAMIVLGSDGRTYACFEPDGVCQIGTVPRRDPLDWDLCPADPYDLNPPPPRLAPPAPATSLLAITYCGPDGKTTIYYALLPAGRIWRWVGAEWYASDSNRRLDKIAGGAALGAGGGFVLAVIVSLALWLIRLRKPTNPAPGD